MKLLVLRFIQLKKHREWENKLQKTRTDFLKMDAAFDGEQCPVSDPANPHELSKRGEENLPSSCFYNCGEQRSLSSDCLYRCITCDVDFHRSCYEYPKKIRHIYHFQHPLTLTTRDDETKSVLNKCNWCGGDLDYGYYRCSICGFCLDFFCVRRNSPPITIINPKSHQHPLLFFPRPFSLPCDACGLVNIWEPVYTCFQCNYMVHLSCISLPCDIKITRHPHRLSYTPFFPPDISTCQICYKTVDIKYGQYSCRHDGCSYVAHSKCATHERVWDGNELEWEPEETNEIEDIQPFEKVGVDLIKYFFHEHQLKLHKYDKLIDADKQCEACIFPVSSRDFYSCVQCDFFLHEVCANLPRKLDHALHQHPLFLKPSHLDDAVESCSTCQRKSSGFLYRCSRNGCQDRNMQLDIRCILVPDCFTHKCHQHPLFIDTCFWSDIIFTCKGCNGVDKYNMARLQCTLCDFILCYDCATIPVEVYYKHDEHPLSLCFGEEVDGTYWCEICEKKLDPTRWFYTCTKCCITIHSSCLLGSSMYMKYGFTFHHGLKKLEVVRNNGNTRPFCNHCDKRCHDSVYYKHQERSFCSTMCSWSDYLQVIQ